MSLLLDEQFYEEWGVYLWRSMELKSTSLYLKSMDLRKYFDSTDCITRTVDIKAIANDYRICSTNKL